MKFPQLLVAIAVTWFALLAHGLAPSEAKKPVTVFLVRHAETAASTLAGGDPELSDAGRARAVALARLLAKAGVTHLYASELQRTQHTLAPLARGTKLEVEVVSARDPEAQLAALRALAPGSIAVVAGHSNTVPGLTLGLGGAIADVREDPEYGPLLDHDEYDRLFIVTLPHGEDAAVQTIELRYGE